MEKLDVGQPIESRGACSRGDASGGRHARGRFHVEDQPKYGEFRLRVNSLQHSLCCVALDTAAQDGISPVGTDSDYGVARRRLHGLISAADRVSEIFVMAAEALCHSPP